MIKFTLFVWSQITLSGVLHSLIIIIGLMSSVSHCSKVITLTGFQCTNIIHNFINIIGIVLIWLLLSFFTHTILITLRDFHCIKQFTEFNYPLKIKWFLLYLYNIVTDYIVHYTVVTVVYDWIFYQLLIVIRNNNC